MLYSRFYGLLLFGLIFIYQMQGMMRWVDTHFLHLQTGLVTWYQGDNMC